MFSSPNRPSPPSSLVKTKRKASGNDDVPFAAARFDRYDGASSPAHGSPSRKHPRLPALNLPQRMSFASSSSTVAFPPSDDLSPSSPFNNSSVPDHATGTVGVSATNGGGMDVDECVSSSEEGELRTPCYPDNLAQYPFGVRAQGTGGGMDIDGSAGGGAGKTVGLMGPQGSSAGVHGPSCTSIPRVVLSHPNPDGQSSLWSVCRDCGAASAC